MRRLLPCLLCFVAALAAPARARAQDAVPGAEARFHFGPLALQPRFKLTNVGVDTNVLNSSTNPLQDFTATFVPEVDHALPFGRARLTGRTTVSFVYFQTLEDQRSIDLSQAERLTVQLAHVTPRADVAYINSDQRPNAEIDARVHRTQTTLGGGLSARLAPKVGIDFSGSQVQYAFADVNVSTASVSRPSSIGRHERGRWESVRGADPPHDVRRARQHGARPVPDRG